ncbi:MAG TPA: acetyl-CoA C-acetyltransferase [Egibacteraceae bacterium]|nr:acetyl-CoA C-acetyltransferase [Egibacteraceae bacterium]
MNEAVIVGYARTPIGKFGGGLSSMSAMDLGGVAIKGALERSGVPGDAVEYVVMGHVLQAGQGQITARQAAFRAGIGMNTPALTVNKVCLSGMSAIALANQAISLGEFDVVVAGGMESMSNAPYLLPKARTGYRMGNGQLVDAMIHDGLWCAFDDGHMGEGSDKVNTELQISREAQDEWSAASHERAVSAWKDGRFADEVVPVAVPQRKGDPITVDTDEGMRPGTTPESLSKLVGAFNRETGTITAGNASQISDGAAALVLASRAKAEELGLQPLGRVVSYGTVAGPDPSLHHQPAAAIEKAAARIDADPAGFDLYEMNEAFASVAIHSAKLLGLDSEKVNVNGGAVALGHPIGCTGARITITLLNELRNRGGGRGAAALCGGGGQGDAIIVETL